MLIAGKGVGFDMQCGDFNDGTGHDATLDLSRTTTDTKKPAGLAPCGLSGLHRMTLVITDGEFWWSCGS